MSERRSYQLLVLGIALYTLTLSYQTICRYSRLDSMIFDLGIHDQAIWLASVGLNPFVTTRGLTIQGDHFQPLAYAVAPLYSLWNSTLVLLWLQSLLFAVGAYPVFGLALEQGCSRRVALIFAALYLMHPSLQWGNEFDFHFNALIVTPLLLALMYLRQGPLWRYWVPVGLTVLCGEAGGIITIFLTSEALRSRGRGVALATVIMGILGTATTNWVIRLHSGGLPYQYGILYCHYGSSGGEIIGNLVSHPLSAAGQMFDSVRRDYLKNLVGATGGLALLGLDGLFPCIPVLAGNLLSWRESQQNITYQYNAALIPFFMWASILGYGRLRRLLKPTLARAIFLIAVAIAVDFSLSLGPANGPFWKSYSADRAGYEADVRDIPSQASVACENPLGAGLAHRQEIFLFPNPIQSIAWGGRPQAMIDQTGRGFDAASPGAVRRALESTKLDFAILRPQDEEYSWPLNIADRLYFLQQLEAYPKWGGEIRSHCVIFGPTIVSHSGRPIYAIAGVWAGAHGAELDPLLSGQAGDGRLVMKQQELPVDVPFKSANGTFRLVFQADGNLVLYKAQLPLWSSATEHRGVHCLLQSDGDLVVKAGDHATVWTSNSTGNPGSSLVLQDDGNLVIYSAEGRPLWATHTEGR